MVSPELMVSCNGSDHWHILGSWTLWALELVSFALVLVPIFLFFSVRQPVTHDLKHRYSLTLCQSRIKSLGLRSVYNRWSQHSPMDDKVVNDVREELAEVKQALSEERGARRLTAKSRKSYHNGIC